MHKNALQVAKLILFYSLIVLILYFPLFDPNPHFHRFISNDFIQTYYPWISSLLDNVRLDSHKINYWNFLASAGTPGWFEYKLFYLPIYILLIPYTLNNNFLNISHLEIFIILHIIFGCVGMHLFLREKIGSTKLAVFGATMFAISGFMVNIAWIGYIIAITLVPWILICLDKYLKSNKYSFLIIGSFLAFQQFAACAQFFVYCMIFIFAYVWIFYNLKDNIPKLVKFYLSTTIFSFIYIFPLIQYMHYAVRYNYIDEAYTLTGVSSFRSVINLILFLPNDVTYSYIYIGIIPITLIIAYLISTKDKKIFKMIATASLVFLFSSKKGIFSIIIRFIPFLNSVRWQSRFNEFIIILLIFTFLLSIKNVVFNLKRELSILISLLVIATIYLFIQKGNDQLTEQYFFLIVMSLLFSFTLLSYHSQILNKQVFVSIVLLLSFFELSQSFIYMRNYNIDSERFKKPNEQTAWYQKKLYSSNNKFRIPPTDYLKYDYNKFLISHQPAGGATSSAGGEVTPATLKYYDDFLNAAKKNNILYLLDNVSFGAGALPRAFTVRCYSQLGSDQDTLNALSNLKFLGDRSVYLDQNPKDINLTKVGSEEEINNCDRYLSVEYHQNNDQITFDPIYRENDTLLFISDNWYPDWKVYVNGIQQPLLRANHTFKAVGLKKGTSNVIFKYEPDAIKKGAYITFGYLILSIGLIIFNRRKNAQKT